MVGSVETTNINISVIFSYYHHIIMDVLIKNIINNYGFPSAAALGLSGPSPNAIESS